MKQLVIKKEDFYVIDGKEYFRYIDMYGHLRTNLYVKLSKNSVGVLRYIANHCELNWDGLKKNQLADLIEKSNCLVSE